MWPIFGRNLKWALLLGCLLSSTGFALGLQDAYSAALEYDAQYRAAKHEYEAGKLSEKFARSGLLPNLSFSSGASKTVGDREISYSASGPSHERLSYVSRQTALNLRVPIYNLAAISEYRQAEIQVAYAESLYMVRGNELAIRLAGAYFDFLLASYNNELSQAQVAAFQEQAIFSRQLYRGGEATRTEIAESESQLDIAKAQLIDSQDQLDTARRALQSITGLSPDSFKPFRGNFTDPGRETLSLDSWLQTAGARNPLLAVRRHSVESAKQEVARNQAGHFPRLDFVASFSRSSSDSINTINQEVNTRSGGIQLTIPIYSGGYVSTATDKAIAALKKSEAELDSELSNVQLEVRRQYLAMNSGLAKIDAYLKAVKSSEIALEGTRVGSRVGTRTNLDLLDAQRRVFSAKRDLAQARYSYLLASLKLKATSGVLTEDDLSAVDKLIMQP